MIASEVKLSLMNYYPDEHPIKVVRAAGIPGQEKIAEIPLFELDRLDWIDHLTCVYLPPDSDSKAMVSRFPVDRLVDIMERLRDIGGCPWDREQTHDSLKKYLVEETYETLDAIDEGNMYKVCEELGDLLLQIAFHAQIAREDGFFDINDIVEAISRKLVRRHPHVFGGVRVKGSEEVSANWEEIKKGELEEKGEVRQSLLDGIPQNLPSLMKADKIQHKAAKVGFDWPDYNGALGKVFEEIAELKEALDKGEQKGILDETGDLLFAVVNLARLLKVNPEEALGSTIRKFKDRFIYMEKRALQARIDLEKMDLKELDKLWEEAKISLKGKKTESL
jgi:tetrapyrrole methylase family protein/MazG family protein